WRRHTHSTTQESKNCLSLCLCGEETIQFCVPPPAQSSATHPSASQTAPETATAPRPTAPYPDRNVLQSAAHPLPPPPTPAPWAPLYPVALSRARDRPSSADARAYE